MADVVYAHMLDKFLILVAEGHNNMPFQQDDQSPCFHTAVGLHWLDQNVISTELGLAHAELLLGHLIPLTLHHLVF
jgi:hypothetical protein